jgi:hypothetical protein
MTYNLRIYNKVPVWKVVLGIGGPKVEGTQIRSGRPPTDHEKIQKFVKYIEDHNLATSERPSLMTRREPGKEEPFIIESASARRAVISKNGHILNIWVSMCSDQQEANGRWSQGALYLIEDFRGNDDRPRTTSAYSSLYLLLNELDWLGQTSISNPIEKLRKQDDATRHFALDPLGTLASIGAQIGPEQQIRAIYRFRASCVEMEGEADRAMTTIGYPIVIHQGRI